MLYRRQTSETGDENNNSRYICSWTWIYFKRPTHHPPHLCTTREQKLYRIFFLFVIRCFNLPLDHPPTHPLSFHWPLYIDGLRPFLKHFLLLLPSSSLPSINQSINQSYLLICIINVHYQEILSFWPARKPL